MKMSGQVGQWTNTLFLLQHSFYFCCGPGPMTSSYSSLGIHIPPSSINRVAHHPPHTAKQGRKPLSTSSPVPDAASQKEKEPGSFSLLQANGSERKEQQGKSTHREDLLPSQSRVSGERLDYNPRYVFISPLFTRCCSPWLSYLLATKARFIISSPGDRKNPAGLQSKPMKTMQ